ncbi:hypothetical protein D3C76_1228270 [compost metagenome]
MVLSLTIGATSIVFLVPLTVRDFEPMIIEAVPFGSPASLDSDGITKEILSKPTVPVLARSSWPSSTLTTYTLFRDAGNLIPDPDRSMFRLFQPFQSITLAKSIYAVVPALSTTSARSQLRLISPITSSDMEVAAAGMLLPEVPLNWA